MASIELAIKRERERGRERHIGGKEKETGQTYCCCALSGLPRAIYHYQSQAAETFHVTSKVAGVLLRERERERGIEREGRSMEGHLINVQRNSW